MGSLKLSGCLLDCQANELDTRVWGLDNLEDPDAYHRIFLLICNTSAIGGCLCAAHSPAFWWSWHRLQGTCGTWLSIQGPDPKSYLYGCNTVGYTRQLDWTRETAFMMGVRDMCMCFSSRRWGMVIAVARCHSLWCLMRWKNELLESKDRGRCLRFSEWTLFGPLKCYE